MARRSRSKPPASGARISRFGEMLERFRLASGVLSAALVDLEGETVDLATDGEPFDVKIAAAELQLVMTWVRSLGAPVWPQASELVIRARARSFSVFFVEEGYCLVCVLRRHSFEVSRRAVTAVLREIAQEAGWKGRTFSQPPSDSGRWTQVEVRVGHTDSRRPVAVWLEGNWQLLNILGRYSKELLGRGEVGYRARLESGAEMTLVREPLGTWYSDL